MPVEANAGSDQTYAFSALSGGPFSHGLTGSASGGTGPYTWQWYLLDKPAGSAAALDNASAQSPNLTAIDSTGTYLLFLVATDSLAVVSETKRSAAKDAAFVKVVVTTEHEAITKPAAGERNHQLAIHGALDKLDALRGDHESHTIADHDTSATGAQLDTLTDGSNADALHTHSALSIAAATEAALGVVQLADEPANPAAPKVVTQDREPFSGYANSSMLATGIVLGVIKVQAPPTNQSEAHCHWIVPETLHIGYWSAGMDDAGADSGAGVYTFALYEMTAAQFKANNFGAATVLGTINLTPDAHQPSLTTNGPNATVSPGNVLAVRCTAEPEEPGGGLHVLLIPRQKN